MKESPTDQEVGKEETKTIFRQKGMDYRQPLQG